MSAIFLMLLFLRAFILYVTLFFSWLFSKFFVLAYHIPLPLSVSTTMYGHLIYVVLADCVRELSSSIAWFEVSTRD